MEHIKKNITWIIIFVLIVSGIMYLFTSHSYAYTKGPTKHSSGMVSDSGYLYLYIKDHECNGKDSKIKILVSTKSKPTYSDMINTPTTWTFSIDKENSVNNHNVKLEKTSITTQLAKEKDATKAYYTTFYIPVSYTMPAYHNHLTMDSNHPSDKTRLNLRDGKKDDPEAGTYTPRDENREGVDNYQYYNTSGTCHLTIQTNTANLGIKTFGSTENGYYFYYNCSITNEIFIPHKSVFRSILAEGFSLTNNPLNQNSSELSANKDKLYLYPKETIYETIDWNSDITFSNNFGNPDSPKGSNNKGAPNGYHMGDKVYYKDNILSPILKTDTTPARTINMTGMDKTFTLYYTPIDYDIKYTDSINDGETKLPANTSYTVCNAKTLATPTRSDKRTFLGWKVVSGSPKDKTKTVSNYSSGLTTQNISVLSENKINANNNGSTSYFKNSSLTSANFYTYMDKRTTGNITLQAIWSTPKISRKQWVTGFPSNSFNLSLNDSENSIVNEYGSAMVLCPTTALDSVQNQSLIYPEKYFFSTVPNGMEKDDRVYYDNDYHTPLFNTGVKPDGDNMVFTLYYKPRDYNITYTDSLNDGKSTLPSNTTYNISTAKTLGTPTRNDGRHFLGWQVTSGTIKDKTKSVKTILSGTTVSTINVLNENKINANNNGNTTYYNNSKLNPDNFYTAMNDRSTGNVTLKAIWSTPPEIKTPCKNNIEVSTKDNNEINPYMMNYDADKDGKKEKCIVFQKDDTCTPKLYQKTTDAVDGDITNTDKVTGKTSGIRETSDISKPLVLDEHGKLNVDYNAVNSNGDNSTNDNTIYANDPPDAESTDITIFRGDDETLNELLFTENVDLHDVEDGNQTKTEDLGKIEQEDVKDMCSIESVTKDLGFLGNLTAKLGLNVYADDSVDNVSKSIDTDEPGTYKVKYKVEDSMKGETEDEFKVTIIDFNAMLNKTHIRFISKDYLSTLKDKSIWKENSEYNNVLTTSLNKEKGQGTTYSLND